MFSDTMCEQVLQEPSQIPCALQYKFVFSSDTCNVTLKDSEKCGAIFWVVVSNPEWGPNGPPWPQIMSVSFLAYWPWLEIWHHIFLGLWESHYTYPKRKWIYMEVHTRINPASRVRSWIMQKLCLIEAVCGALMCAGSDAGQPRWPAEAKAGVWRSQAPAWNF